MELSTLFKILTSAPSSGRYVAMQAHQAMITYAKAFGTPVPEWLKYESNGHIASLCTEAINANA